MAFAIRSISGFCLALVTFCLIGCGAEEPQSSPLGGEPETMSPAGDDAASALPASPTDGTAPMQDQLHLDTEAARIEIEAALAELPPADRELAEKQKICPVGGGPLGGMGTPVKVTVAGHEVFICCEGCEGPLQSDPEKYLTKIGLEPATDQPLPQ